MAKAPESTDEFLDLARRSGVIDERHLDLVLKTYQKTGERPRDLSYFARMLIRDGVLTYFQADQLLRGKHRGFFLGNYRLLEKIGSGGMGQVFLAEHGIMKRRAALKILPILGQSDETVQRFFREARAVAALDHPNIIAAHDIDSIGDLHYLAMDFIEGPSLHDIVNQTGQLPFDRAANYIAQAAIGLHSIHSNELIHRDIKPGNLIVDRQGVVKILDLGLARFNEDSERLTAQLDINSFLGTADYLSPEQGIDSSKADHRADIYALGATFHFLLTGRPPFHGSTPTEKLIAHQTQKPRPVIESRPDTPRDLNDLILAMLEKNRDRRTQSAAAVVECLRPWLEKEIAPPAEKSRVRLSPLALTLPGQAPAIPAPAARAPQNGSTSAPGGLQHTPTPGATGGTSSPALQRPTVSPVLSGGQGRGTATVASLQDTEKMAGMASQTPLNLSRPKRSSAARTMRPMNSSVEISAYPAASEVQSIDTSSIGEMTLEDEAAMMPDGPLSLRGGRNRQRLQLILMMAVGGAIGIGAILLLDR